MKMYKLVQLKAVCRTGLFGLLLFFAFLFSASAAEAASLALTPGTGVYTANSTFTVQVVIHTNGQAVNAAEGTLSFNPRELSVVSVNRAGSIFNLWVTEPSFSNGAGTVTFSGGSPAGYSGRTGTIMSVTFRAAGAGSPRVQFTDGSVLANDGRGTNILTAMNGGTYTIQAANIAPEPEVIEYVPPSNAPAAPLISSDTHGDPEAWHASNEAILRWALPADVTAVRTLLNETPTSIPTKVYDTPIDTITLADLPEGESYFHLQFQNADGWGQVTHYRLAVDTENPTSIAISQPGDTNFASPEQTLQLTVEDATSAVKRFLVKIDADEPVEYLDPTGSSTITLPALAPGYHTVIIEAFDEAGNSIVGTYSFTIEAFSQPEFTEYPREMNEEVIPVIKGLTRPNAAVEITLHRIGSEASVYHLRSDETGGFVFIPDGTFTEGVYEITAQATDEYGATSLRSDPIRIAVQQPGYLRLGGLIVSTLSVLIPLVILLFALIFGVWYLLRYAGRFRKKVRVESLEAMEMLRREFSSLRNTLKEQEKALQASRKTKKLTKAEAAMLEAFDTSLQTSEKSVEKEIADITELTRKKK